jgi:hypothetical protein
MSVWLAGILFGQTLLIVKPAQNSNGDQVPGLTAAMLVSKRKGPCGPDLQVGEFEGEWQSMICPQRCVRN